MQSRGTKIVPLETSNGENVRVRGAAICGIRPAKLGNTAENPERGGCVFRTIVAARSRGDLPKSDLPAARSAERGSI